MNLDNHNTGILVSTDDQKLKVFDIISRLLSGLKPGFIGLNIPGAISPVQRHLQGHSRQNVLHSIVILIGKRSL